MVKIEYMLLIPAFLLMTGAYYLYYKDIKRFRVHPSKVSWALWCVSSLLETITYSFITQDWLKQISFITSALACLVLTISIWRISKWQRPDVTDSFIILLAILSSIVWYRMDSAWMAHLVLMISVPIGFLPTIRNAIKDFRNEDNPAWWLWSLSDALVIVVVLLRLESIQELPYMATEFICHFSVFAIVYFQKIRWQHCLSHLRIEKNHLGKAVFSKAIIRKGDEILKFTGRVMPENLCLCKSG